MTIPAETAREQYAGSGSTGPFAFNHITFDATHLLVVKTVSGVDTTLVLNTHYTVVLATDFSSATITLVSALAVGEALTVIIDPPLSQLASYPRNDPFPSSTHERALDLLVRITQRQKEQLARSLWLPESATVSGLKLPSPDALKFLRWNAAETALENMSISSPGQLAVSAFTETLLDDASAAAFLTTLGVSAFIQTLLDDASAATARATLGVVTATETIEGVVELATDGEIRSAATGAKAIMSSDLETASAGVALSDAATVAVDWDTAINFTLTVTANRIIGNPTNGQPGTWRTILVQGNDTTDRTITFGNQYLGEVPTIVDCDSTRWYLLMVYCVSTTHFVVSSKKAFGT